MNGKDATFVHDLVHTFTLEERQLLMLHYVEELSPAEIGVILDRSDQEVLDMLAAIRVRTREALSSQRLAS